MVGLQLASNFDKKCGVNVVVAGLLTQTKPNPN